MIRGTRILIIQTKFTFLISDFKFQNDIPTPKEI